MSLIRTVQSTKVYFNKESVAVGTLYLFHISAIIGISLGYFNWFAPKTPLNLMVMFAILCFMFPLTNTRNSWLAAIFFMTGMVAEVLGVQWGLLFGEYSYGDNLGFKIAGVPLLIGINWALLVFITGSISQYWFDNKFLRMLSGASLMVGLDFFIEQAAPGLDFWFFEGGIVPASNYIAWFLISFVLHGIFVFSNAKGSYRVSKHLFIVQLLFFGYLFFSINYQLL